MRCGGMPNAWHGKGEAPSCKQEWNRSARTSLAGSSRCVPSWPSKRCFGGSCRCSSHQVGFGLLRLTSALLLPRASVCAQHSLVESVDRPL